MRREDGAGSWWAGEIGGIGQSENSFTGLLEFSSHPARPQILVAVAKQTISSIICQTILNVL